MSENIEIGRHTLILTTAGSFTVAGRRLADPVDTAEKLGKLILWAARKLGGLKPVPLPGGEPAPARVWVVGGAVALLVGGAAEDEDGGHTGGLGRALAPLVEQGWELRGGAGPAVIVARGRGPERLTVEILPERHPWLAGEDSAVVDDAVELGRRLGAWFDATGVLPTTNAAHSGAAVLDHIMAGRSASGRGAVLSSPGTLPAWVTLPMRIQPPWATDIDQIEREFQHCDELICLTQDSPALASAGMLTFGYGASEPLDAAAAAAAASSAKRPFGTWLVELPAAEDLQLPNGLPLPHPQMAVSHRVQAWITTEDLAGLTADVRDGGAGLTIEQLDVSEAVVWRQQNRVLEAWATKLRTARERFVNDPALLRLISLAINEYLTAMADPHMWALQDEPPGDSVSADDNLRHHYQPVFAATIAAHARWRTRRAAMRISREHRCWPIYIEDTTMVYGPTPAEADEPPIDLADTHTRLGRLITAARTELTQQTILALLLAESTDDVRAALTAALGLSAIPAGHAGPEIAAGTPVRVGESTPSVDGDREPEVQTSDDEVAAAEQGTAEPDPTPTGSEHQDGRSTARRRAPKRGQPVELGGNPAAVLHTDGLWMADGTKKELNEPISHVGQVAELAYTHQLGYQLAPGYGEPGQVWITEEACRAFGIDVDTVLEKKPKDRDGVLREITQEIPFVAAAVADGWQLGGAGEGGAARLGIWTRVFPADKTRKGVWVALIPGMASPDDSPKIVGNVPVLIDGSNDDGGVNLAPAATVAHRLKMLADALRFPLKINPGVTAIDLMKQTRPKGTTIEEWINGPLAPSTFDLPFTINDVEREFNWTRTLTTDEQKCLYVHAYDRGGSYPAAIAGLELPIGEPVHFPDGSVFEDPQRLKELIKAPGLVTIVIPKQQDWRVPFLLNPAGLQFTSPKPTTTARLQHALVQGYKPTVVEAYTWPNHGRVLKGFYERVRDASVSLDINDADAQAARNQSKVIRNTGIGLLGSDTNLKGKTGYDPMKRYSIVGKASANIAYRIDQIGQATDRWPVAAEKDTVLYVSDSPDPRAAWPGEPATWGRGFGQYKHEGSALLVDHIQYLNGGAYKGKAALLDPDEWAELHPRCATHADAEAGS
ncbi:hypothetical protein QN239_31790 [Mycolicibacterium sp. Y3]